MITQGMAVLLGPLVTLLFFNLASSANLRDISRGAEVALWILGSSSFGAVLAAELGLQCGFQQGFKTVPSSTLVQTRWEGRNDQLTGSSRALN